MCYLRSVNNSQVENSFRSTTLKYRRLRKRGDMIEVLKITHNLYDRTVSHDLSFNERANTRDNNYKLHKQSFHYDLRSIFLCTCR